jgi:hypothetical protein
MAERDDLLAAIAERIADYREGDIPAPSPEHVSNWVCQFEAPVQVPILREMNHVLARTYFSRRATADFMKGLFKSENLVGTDPCAFWKGVKFLDIQQGGASQKEMLALFNAVLERECGFGVDDCGEKGTDVFIYLDDAIFTGNRVRNDFEHWIANAAPAKATVHVITIALHSGGQYYARKKIHECAAAHKKTIAITWWRAIELEDRRYYTDTSDVLRPVAIPDDPAVQEYVADMTYKPHLRHAGNVGKAGLFSSDEGRQLLEIELLKAGVKIRHDSPLLGPTQRPLGHMTLETLGFGSLIATFRNCPNNAPLALWAGNPWYPLFPRSTNSQTAYKLLLKALEKDPF